MEEENLKKYFEFKKNFIDSIILIGEIYNSLLKILQTETDTITRQRIEEKATLTKKMTNDFFNAFWDFKDQSKPLQEAIKHLRETQILETNKKLQTPLPSIRKQLSKVKEQEQYLQNIIKPSDSELATYENFFIHDYRLFQYLVTRLQDYIIFQSFDTDLQKLKTYSDDLNSINTWLETYTQIKDELPKTQSEYKTLKENTINLYQEIDLLRRGVISAGLAKRYSKEKKNNNYPKWLWTIAIILGLILLAFFTNLPSTIYSSTTTPTSKQIRESESFSKAVLHIISTLPAYIACVWFILFALRRRNEANRLASDYAHKEVFASSYEAYQEEIKKLKEMHPNKEKELTELNIKLLDSMISVLSDNPAKSLDTKKATDELPAKELINFASEIIKLKGKQ